MITDCDYNVGKLDRIHDKINVVYMYVLFAQGLNVMSCHNF